MDNNYDPFSNNENTTDNPVQTNESSNQFPPEYHSSPEEDSASIKNYSEPGYEGTRPTSSDFEKPLHEYGSSYIYSSTGERYTSFNSSHTEPQTPRREKKRNSFLPVLAGLISILLVLCCGAAGYLGACYGLEQGSKIDTSSPLVIYRNTVVETSSDVYPSQQAAVAASVSSSVVEISTSETLTQGMYQYTAAGSGSGVIISTDGYIVTCQHVIASSSGSGYVSSIIVTMNNGKTYYATVIGGDSDTDIALIKIDPEEALNPAVFPAEDSQLVVGENVIAIGNPLGKLGGSVTGGIISALERQITIDNQVYTVLQTDTAINSGNSGGGLFNMKGELVGIVSAKTVSSGVEGICYAVPSSIALSVITQLKEYGYVTGKPYIGFVLRDVSDASTAYYLYRRRSAGVYIDSLANNENTSLFKVGDKIISVDGLEITSSNDIATIISKHSVGDKISFTLSRINGSNSELVTVEATVLEYVPNK